MISSPSSPFFLKSSFQKYSKTVNGQSKNCVFFCYTVWLQNYQQEDIFGTKLKKKKCWRRESYIWTTNSLHCLFFILHALQFLFMVFLFLLPFTIFFLFCSFVIVFRFIRHSSCFHYLANLFACVCVYNVCMYCFCYCCS